MDSGEENGLKFVFIGQNFKNKGLNQMFSYNFIWVALIGDY